MSRALLLLCLFVGLWTAPAQGSTCQGRIPNPVTDFCWECVLPITLGSIPTAASKVPDAPTNPGSPICQCPAPPPVFVRYGLAVGYWEPARIVEVVREPGCMVSLGGVTLNAGVGPGRAGVSSLPGQTRGATWHAHWYTYPLSGLASMMGGAQCGGGGTFEATYLSELDSSWLNDDLALLLSPEAVLTANLPSQLVCAADCTAATLRVPSNTLSWCAGCQGPMFPLSGHVPAHVSDVQSTLLIAQRVANRVHRLGLEQDTSGSEALCGARRTLRFEKNSWRTQGLYPNALTNAAAGCKPLGASTLSYESQLLSASSTDYSYVFWRKRNCCVL